MSNVGWVVRLARLFGLDTRPTSTRGTGGGSDGRGPFWTGDASVGDMDSHTPNIRFLEKREQQIYDERRQMRYAIYDEMDLTDIVSSVLDVYMEDATETDTDTGLAIWVTSNTAHIREAANSALLRVNADARLPSIARAMCKYGDDFQRLVYRTSDGVLAMQATDPSKVHRKEDKFGVLLGFNEDGKKFRGTGSALSWPWDYVHFALPGKYYNSLYGTSILNGSRRPWFQLVVAEDNALLYRLMRAPDRLAWLIDTGTQSESQAFASVQRFRARVNRNQHVDPISGTMATTWRPRTPIDDYYIPSPEHAPVRVDKIPGSANVNDVTDLEYHQNRLFASLRVPKAFLGYMSERGGVGMDFTLGKTLANQSIRYAKGVKRIQRALRQGFRRLIETHFVLIEDGPDDDKYDWFIQNQDFDIQMTPPSFLEEQERMEFLQLKATMAETMLAMRLNAQNIKPYEWTVFVLSEILGLEADRVEKVVQKAAPKPDEGDDRKGEGFDVDPQGQLTGDERSRIMEAIDTNEQLRDAIVRFAHVESTRYHFSDPIRHSEHLPLPDSNESYEDDIFDEAIFDDEDEGD